MRYPAQASDTGASRLSTVLASLEERTASAIETCRAVRSFHAIDWQNLNKGRCPYSPEPATRLWEGYAEAASYKVGDRGVFSAGPKGLLALGRSAAPAFRLLDAPLEPDGADIVLIEAAWEAITTGGFGRLVIGSGDGGFALLARCARKLGLHVVLVSYPASCSRALRREVCEFRPLGGCRAAS